MDVKILASRPDYLEFALHHVDNSLANALRRVMISEVPMLAIDEVTIRSNTSVIHDEMLAHRLGMVPIWSAAAPQMNLAWGCPCEGGVGCTRCTVEMELAVRCRVGELSRAVTASDLRVTPGPLAEQVYPVKGTHNEGKGVWLCTLGPGQEVNLRCVVRKGIAKEHAKWMPVATVGMQYESEITLHEEALGRLSLAERKAFPKVCPVGVFAYDEFHDEIVVENADKCIFCQDCVQPEGSKEELVTVRYKSPSLNKYNYVFRVEGIGVLPMEYILRTAVEVLVNKLTTFKDSLSGEKEAKKVSKGEDIQNAPEKNDGGPFASETPPDTGLMSVAWV